MKSTFIKESKNVLPTVLFEFNPTAKIERKNIATKRPLSATAASHSKYNNFFPTNKENKNSNNLIKVSKIFKTAFEKLKPNSEKKDISLSKFNPTFKKLKQNPEFSSNHQLIKDLQNKFITTEKIPKYAANNQLQNTQVQQDAISNFEDDTIIKENKLTSKVLDFETIFNKFMESDETVVKKENLKKDEIKTEIHEKLLDSFEFFLDKFEKEGVKKKTPIQIPLKKPNEPPIKKMEYISKNFEGKTSGEVFQHFKKKFKISEILLKNLQQIKEIKQNFKLIKNTAIEEKNSGKAPSELEQIKPQTKQINTQDSFEDVRETTINKEKTKTEINKYQSNAAQKLFQLYNESLKNEDEQFQELNKKIPLKKVLSYDEEGGMATSQEEKPQKVEIKKIKNPAFENIQGNYVEFMSNKNDFDFKKFIESLDPEIKNTNKQKIEEIIKNSLMPSELKRIEIKAQRNPIRRLILNPNDENLPKIKITSKNLKDIIKLSKTTEKKEKEIMKQKGLKEQNNLNKILSNEIKPVQNILNSIKGI